MDRLLIDLEVICNKLGEYREEDLNKKLLQDLSPEKMKLLLPIIYSRVEYHLVTERIIHMHTDLKNKTKIIDEILENRIFYQVYNIVVEWDRLRDNLKQHKELVWRNEI